MLYYRIVNNLMDRSAADISTEVEKRERARTKFLFVGHDKHAVPTCGRFISDVLLTALQINARGTILRPLLEKFLECVPRGFPMAMAIELAGPGKHFHLGTHYCR